jgi:hypothetical protein
MTIASNEEVKFFSDGRNMLVAMGGCTYLLKDVMLKSLEMHQEYANIREETPRGHKLCIPAFPTTVELDLRLMVCGDVEVTDKINLSDFKSASNMTVKELFKVINKKLNKRGEENE